MKFKTQHAYLFSSVCFLFAGVVNLVEKKYPMGIMFVALCLAYFSLSMIHNKETNKENKKQLPPEEMDKELKSLIERGKRVEAIKAYRMFTGAGLKESKDYVDVLAEEYLK